VIPRILIAALCLLPAVARAADTDPTTGDSDSESDGETGEETSTMPPEYDPCGCRSDQLGGAGTFALAGLALLALRRRGLSSS